MKDVFIKSVEFSLKQNLSELFDLLVEQLRFMKYHYDLKIKTNQNGDIIRIELSDEPNDILGRWVFFAHDKSSESATSDLLSKRGHDSTGVFVTTRPNTVIDQKCLPEVLRSISMFDTIDISNIDIFKNEMNMIMSKYIKLKKGILCSNEVNIEKIIPSFDEKSLYQNERESKKYGYKKNE